MESYVPCAVGMCYVDAVPTVDRTMLRSARADGGAAYTPRSHPTQAESKSKTLVRASLPVLDYKIEGPGSVAQYHQL